MSKDFTETVGFLISIGLAVGCGWLMDATQAEYLIFYFLISLMARTSKKK